MYTNLITTSTGRKSTAGEFRTKLGAMIAAHLLRGRYEVETLTVRDAHQAIKAAHAEAINRLCKLDHAHNH